MTRFTRPACCRSSSWALMGLAMLVYVVLDGYDLGVGMLLPFATTHEKDCMVASHRPVLGRQRDLAGARHRHPAGRLPEGARPGAGRAVPAGGADADRPDPARRGVRLPRQGQGQRTRRPGTGCSSAGSLLAAACAGLDARALHQRLRATAGTTRLRRRRSRSRCRPPTCCSGAGWLMMKTEGELQREGDRAGPACAWLPVVRRPRADLAWRRRWSVATVRDRWFALPEFIALLPIPLGTGVAL